MDRVVNYLQNINLRPEYLVFLLSISLVFIVFLFLARLIKLYLPKISYGLIVISLWGLLINVSFFFDYLKIAPIVYYAFLIFIVIGFTIYTKIKINLSISDFIKNSENKYLIKIFIVWCAGVLIMLLPLIFLLSKGTNIPAAGISTDSMIHSLLSQGIAYTDSINLNKYWNEEYPRGIHSFIYYANSVLNIDIKVLLMPMVAFGFSFIIFFVEDLVNKKRYVKGLHKLILMLIPFCSFLILTTSYALFLPQIIVIPVLLITLNLIFKKEFENSKALRYLILINLILTVGNIYGVYALNVIAVAIGLFVLMELWNLYKKREQLPLIKNARFQGIKNYLLPLSLLIALAIPSIIMVYKNTISAFLNSSITFQGEGNLRTGYLSPFHITGLWQPGREYREELGTLFIYILLAVLIFQLYFIFKTKLSKNIYKVNVTLILMVIISLLVFKNTYIHFKYLTYFIPFFLILFGTAVIRFFYLKRIPIVSSLILGVFIIGALGISSTSLNKLPAATDQTFQPLQELKEDYFDKHTAVVLSGDAWVQFYIQEGDDYAPLVNYAFPQREYVNQEFDYLIIDTFFDIEPMVDEFFIKYPSLLEKKDSLNLNCIADKGRFIVYNFKCE